VSGTLHDVTDGNEIHNENTGAVGGSVFQIGAVHGDLVVWQQPSAPHSTDESLREPLLRLAREVRWLSTEVVQERGISGSDALSVRWRTAAENLVDHWENIHDSNEPLSLNGHFTAVRDTYQAVHSKRLVILGQAGAGKTVLAHRLILDLLDTAGATGPVPALFSLSDWNPDSTNLQHWLIQQLARDFGFLNHKNPATGETQAEVLVKEKLILPVLDGFDEIPQPHHRAAISKISNVDYPLVITSRPEEYGGAAQGVKAVGRAAAIELEDVTLDEVHRFLRLSTSKSRSLEWEEVFHYLHTQPDQIASQNLSYVLTTPLMVTLARTIYNDTPGHRPHDLLDDRRFPSAAALEDHLLDAYLYSLYDLRDTGSHSAQRPNWDPGQARHWLGYLATHVKQRNTHDLAWWHLPATLHRYTRVFATMATVGLTLGLVYSLLSGLLVGLVGAFVGGLAIALTVALPVGLAVGLALGLAIGLTAGISNELRFRRGRAGREPERLHLAPRRSRVKRSPLSSLKKSAAEFTSGLVIGLTIGVAWGSAVGLAAGISSGLVGGLAVGITIGLAIGLVNIVVSVLGRAHDPQATTPWTLLATDRTVTLVRAAAAVLASVPVYVLIAGVLAGLTDEITGEITSWLSSGILGGASRLALSAWGDWLLFARVWLPLTGRLPWRPKRFLEDAYDRGVLRRTGAVYQFRHARLRDRLVDHYRAEPGRR
jgi:hypothetical protein